MYVIISHIYYGIYIFLFSSLRLSRMSTKASSPGVEVNDTSLLDKNHILQSDVELMSDEDSYREGSEQTLLAGFTVNSAQPCKRKRATQFDPCEVLDATEAEDGDMPKIIEPPPSVFDVHDVQGPKALETLPKQVNNSFATKPIVDKLNSLYGKYKTPGNCEFTCVPRVNTPLLIKK